MNRYAFILMAMLLAKTSIAQNAQYLHKANVLFTAGAYYDAAENYKRYLGISNDKGSFKPYTVKRTARKEQPNGNESQKALYNLAECYRKLNMYADAEKFYGEVIQKDAKQYPEARLWYGVSLRANQKYEDAEKQLSLCVKEQANNKTIASRAQQELDNLNFISTQLKGKEQHSFNLGKVASPINNKNGNYAVSLIGDSLLLFTSTRTDTAVKKEVPHVNRLYKLSIKDTAKQLQAIVIDGIDKANHQGTSSVTADGKRFYFSVWEQQQSKQAIAAIYMCKREPATGTLSEPVKLQLNMDGYSSMQPFVSPDGKYIFFSSDRAGGLGGNDIWYAETDASGNAQKAVNAGPSINTAYDEQAPFYHTASNTLVFSSNGRTGMGGLDFFASKGTIGKWEQAVNMGYPINSVKDDVYFFSNAKDSLLQQAYISTDRSSDCCLEIYTVSKTYTAPQPKLYKHSITGTVSDRNTNASLKDVSINLASNNEQTGNTTSNEQGGFSFNLKEQDSSLRLSFNKVGYTSLDTIYTAATIQDADRALAIHVYLSPLGEDHKPLITDSATETKQSMPGLIYFDFGSSTLTDDNKKALDALVTILNNNKGLHFEVGGYTDAKGTVAFNLKLGAARAQACIDYLVEKGINKERLHLHAYGECCPIAPDKISNNDNPAGRKQNRRVEFKVNQLGQ